MSDAPNPGKTSTVYLAGMRAEGNRSLLDKLEALCDKVGLAETVRDEDLVAVKVHFGERGSHTFVRPIFVRRIVDSIVAAGGRPFLTDTNTLYVGGRSDAVNHLVTAVGNGFAYSVVGAPLIIGDGLTGKDYVEVEVPGRHIRQARIAGAVYHADGLVGVSHFKGHGMTGFGATLKNVGMGLACRAAKQEIHSEVKPWVDEEVCTACGRCTRWCPSGAITVDGVATIDEDVCVGCGECTVNCLEGAIAVRWESEKANVQERMVEYAYAVLAGKSRKAVFFNFLTDIGPDCDCWPWSDASIVADVGILASTDPVAVDQAGVDLVNRSPAIPGTKLGGAHAQAEDKMGAVTGTDWSAQLVYAEELGLGTREYRLEHIS